MNIKMKLPMKFRILQLVCEKSIQNRVINTGEILNLINLEYGNEKQCSSKNIKKHILGLKSVGLIKEVRVYEAEDKLLSEYKSTKEGFKRMNLIPNTAESYKEWTSFKGRVTNLIHSN